MDLLNSYVRMLRLFLPKGERDDIARELGEEIRSQAAEREAELGRPLNVDEQAALLKQYGHPLLTAARYRPQRYLIGPIVFPYFWLALKVVGGFVLAGHVIGGVVLFGRDPSWQQISEAVGELVQNLLAIAAWFTILGAVAERVLARTRALETWDPKKLLPPLPQRAVQQRPGDPASLSGFVVGVVLSTWWLLALRYPFLMFGNGADNLDWGPAMNRLYPVLLAVQVTTLLEHFSRLRHPSDARLFRLTRVVWGISGVFFVYMILTLDHNWIVWRETADSSFRTQAMVQTPAPAVHPAVQAGPAGTAANGSGDRSEASRSVCRRISAGSRRNVHGCSRGRRVDAAAARPAQAAAQARKRSGVLRAGEHPRVGDVRGQRRRGGHRPAAEGADRRCACV